MGELGKEKAAADYELELGDTVFDLELLGIGKDGHVASLFPNAPTLQQSKRVLPAEPGLEPFVDRVTLSIPALNSAREIVFARLRCREGGGRTPGFCGDAEPRHAGEPRPRARRQNHCNPRSCCCSQARGLTGPPLYVEVPPG